VRLIVNYMDYHSNISSICDTFEKKFEKAVSYKDYQNLFNINIQGLIESLNITGLIFRKSILNKSLGENVAADISGILNMIITDKFPYFFDYARGKYTYPGVDKRFTARIAERNNPDKTIAYIIISVDPCVYEENSVQKDGLVVTNFELVDYIPPSEECINDAINYILANDVMEKCREFRESLFPDKDNNLPDRQYSREIFEKIAVMVSDIKQHM